MTSRPRTPPSQRGVMSRAGIERSFRKLARINPREAREAFSPQMKILGIRVPRPGAIQRHEARALRTG